MNGGSESKMVFLTSIWNWILSNQNFWPAQANNASWHHLLCTLDILSITIIMAEFYMLLWASIFGVNCYSRQSMIQVYLRSNDFCLRNSSSWDVPGAFKRKQPVCNNISLPFTDATFRGLTFRFKKLISLCERASQIFPYLCRCSQVIGSLSQTLCAMQ